MATWNVGPFDNDDAAEWCDRLRSTDPALRATFVEAALSGAVSRSVEVTAATASEVFAAAAIVYQTATGKPASTTPYAAVVLAVNDGIEPTPQLIKLARAALEILMAEDSAFRRKWFGDVEEELALESLEFIHHGLEEQPA
ncbi:DUF4259 domain-containing protein [Actinoplanes sp. NPDC089786]|uniref:DUF4259 domain-containing protein n=1 Tax=Actinoplanes sp. NPDC089786 TaxID=3155185 RepID=UPI00343C2BDC